MFRKFIVTERKSSLLVFEEKKKEINKETKNNPKTTEANLNFEHLFVSESYPGHWF